MKKFLVVSAAAALLVVSLLTGCWKKAAPEGPVPFSRGPSGEPVVGAPTIPPPSAAQ